MKAFIFLILMILFLYVPTKEAMHMFQQNRYQMERYCSWLKKLIHLKYNLIFRLLIMCIPILAICVIPSAKTMWHIYILLLLIYAYVIWVWDHKHAYIQRIKFTFRIRRLFCMFLMFYLICFLLLYIIMPIRLLILLTPIFFFMPWILLILLGSLLNPLEQAIRNSYAREAKAILRDRERLIKVGITGSYGKTSVKNILYTLLSDKYYTFMTPHSYNNLMGLTISIRTLLKPLHEVLIAEMGADHVGEIKQLAQFVQPTIGIVCAVGPQHIETFGSQANILLEKMEMIEQLPIDGIGIVNYDNKYIRSYHIQNTCRIITYGIHEENVDYRASDIKYTTQGSTFTVTHSTHSFQISTCLLGEHNVLNILAAICAAKAMQVDDHTIQVAIKRLRYVEHRLEVRAMDSYTLLDDAYNSNPEGARYALEVLSQMPGQRVLVTPGFLDLGDLKLTAHQTYAKQMLDRTDIIILIGKIQTQDIYETLLQEGYQEDHIYVKATMMEGFALLKELIEEGDTVLIENDLPDAFNH